MKNLKYILFMSFIMFFYINVYACTYGSKTFYIKCDTTTSGSVSCSLGGTNTGKIYLAADYLPDAATIKKCDKIYYALSEDSSQERVKISGIYSEERFNELKKGLFFSDKNYHLLTKMSSGDNETVNTDLSSFNGKACYWKSNEVNGVSLAYVCKIVGGKPNCTLSCAKDSDCNKMYNINGSNNDFINQDFINNGSFACPSNNLYVNTTSSAVNGKLIIQGVTRKKTGNNIFFTRTNVDPTTSNTSVPQDKPITNYNDDPEYKAAKQQMDEFCNSPVAANVEKCEAAKKRVEEIKSKYSSSSEPGGETKPDKEKFDSDNFCQGNVLRVFTTLGWIFFILKILIPLIIIIFGVIDISKAIISSKDDEIKKSAKTLLVRVIAGIIIFLVPSVLNLIVSLIGSKAEDVYNENSGTFADCTSCMLSPTQDYCSVKAGE